MYRLKTARLILETWGGDHRRPFADMNADPEVMLDLGGPLSREQSDAKFEQYRHGLQRDGTTRWAVLSPDNMFLGYSGVVFRPDAGHPLGAHHEVGWRFIRGAWGRGFATESATAALSHAFRERGMSEILSYTSADNARSQAVMGRLGLTREQPRDFEINYPAPMGLWRGLVWSATGGRWRGQPIPAGLD